MAIASHTLAPADYIDLRYNSLRKIEGYTYLPTFVQGVPHIGIGFNLQDEDVFNAVLKVLGVDPTRPNLSDVEIQKENTWISLLRQAMFTPFSDSSSLQSGLNTIMLDRTLDFADGRQTFQFIDDI